MNEREREKVRHSKRKGSTTTTTAETALCPVCLEKKKEGKCGEKVRERKEDLLFFSSGECDEQTNTCRVGTFC